MGSRSWWRTATFTVLSSIPAGMVPSSPGTPSVSHYHVQQSGGRRKSLAASSSFCWRKLRSATRVASILLSCRHKTHQPTTTWEGTPVPALDGFDSQAPLLGITESYTKYCGELTVNNKLPKLD